MAAVLPLPFCGGSSSAATGGIKDAATEAQKANGIGDPVERFTTDTLNGEAKWPKVARALCSNSGADRDCLAEGGHT